MLGLTAVISRDKLLQAAPELSAKSPRQQQQQQQQYHQREVVNADLWTFIKVALVAPF